MPSRRYARAWLFLRPERVENGVCMPLNVVLAPQNRLRPRSTRLEAEGMEDRLQGGCCTSWILQPSVTSQRGLFLRSIDCPMQGARGEVAALGDLLQVTGVGNTVAAPVLTTGRLVKQSMLRREGINSNNCDSTADFDESIGTRHVSGAAMEGVRPVRSAASSDGYSPVANNEEPANCRTRSMTSVRPTAPLPTRHLNKVTGRHDIHVQIHRGPVMRTVVASCVDPSPEVRTGPEEKYSSTNANDDDVAQPPLGFVNRKSVALLQKSESFEPDFQARMQRFQQKGRQKKEELRQRAAVAEQTSAHTPEINKCSKRLRRRVSHLLAWQNEKENKLSRLRAAEAIKEVEPCKVKPAMSMRSHDLLDDRRDEVARCKVEDRLQLLGLIYQYEREERVREQQQMRAVDGPRLAPHSLNLARAQERSVFERLYGQRHRQRQSAGHDRTRETGSGNDRPSVSRREGTAGRGSDVVTRLYAMADRYKQKRIQMSERQAAKAAGMLTTLKLSARSRQLSTKRQRPGHSKSVRLCPCCVREPSECTTAQEQQPQQPRRVGSKSAEAIYEKHVRWQQQREARRLAEKQRDEEAQLQECTFRNPWYRSAWDPLTEEPERSGNEAFYRRSVAWAERREQALGEEKRLWRELEMMECTFKPHAPRRGNVAGGVHPNTRGECRFRCPATAGGRRRRSETRAASPLANYSATDLEALADTSCSDWSCDRSDFQDGDSDGVGDCRDRAPLLLRFSGADAREFAGR